MSRSRSALLRSIPCYSFLLAVLLVCCITPSASAYWEVSYESNGQLHDLLKQFNNVIYDVTHPWPQTFSDSQYWIPNSDEDAFPNQYMPDPFGGNIQMFGSLDRTGNGLIHIEGDITAVLTWKGGGRPPKQVHVVEGSAAVVESYYYISGLVPSLIQGLQEHSTDCGFGVAQQHPDDGTWGQSIAVQSTIANPSRSAIIRLTTRHLKARISCDTPPSSPHERQIGAYVYYRAYVPGQNTKLNAPGDSPSYPPGCDELHPDQGGSPCTSNGNGGPSTPDPVDLTNGQESNEPGPDITVYNPHGPSVVWRRTFRTNHAMSGYSSDGLGTGWVHNYDIAATFGVNNSGNPEVRLRYPGGAEDKMPLDTPTGILNINSNKYRAIATYDPVAQQFTSLVVTWKDGTKWELSLSNAFPNSLILRAIRSRSGQAITFQYLADDTLSSISDEASGDVLLSLVHQNGYITCLVDAYSRKVVYDTQSGELQGVSQIGDANGATPPKRWGYEYFHTEAGGPAYLKKVTVPSPTGTGEQTSTLEYQSDVFYPKVTALIDANGNRTEFEYHPQFYVNGYPSGGFTRIYNKDSNGNLLSRSVQRYDEKGRDTGTDVEDFSGNIVRTSRSEYGNPGCPFSPTKVTTNGRITNYTYDDFGNVVLAQMQGRTMRYTYKTAAYPFNQLESVFESDINGTERVLSTFNYTPEGYLASVETPSPDGSTATTTFVYDSLGNITQTTAPGITSSQPLVTTYNYETDNGIPVQSAQLGQPVAIINALGQVTHIRYDVQGRPTVVTDNAGQATDYTYNVAGQVDTVTLPATGQTGMGRGIVGYTYVYPGGPVNGTKVWDESWQVTRQTYKDYDAEGEVVAEYGDMAEPVRYFYDGVHRLTAIQNDANNALSFYYYNDIGDKYAEILLNDPVGTIQRNFDHDVFGNLTLQSEFNWDDYDGTYRALHFDYDSLDFALNSIYVNDDQTPLVTYTYDSWRRMQARTDHEGTQTYTYGNAADELQSVITQYTGLPAQTIGYTYNHNGTREGMVTPAGTFTYGYDATGRPTTLTNPFNEITAWVYEPVRGLLQSQTSSNGIVATYVHDALGRLTGITNRKANGDILSQYTTPTTGGFDSVGNRLEVAANIPGAPNLSGVTQWAYNNQDRLTGEQSSRFGGWTHTHSYDAAGNITTLRGQSRTYNVQNQLTGGTGLGQFEYDSRGNPTKYNGNTVTWDEQNNATGFGNLLTAGYTADGLRAWKQDTNGNRTYFLYDGITPIIEITGSRHRGSNTVIYAPSAVNTFGANGLVSRYKDFILEEAEAPATIGSLEEPLPVDHLESYLPDYFAEPTTEATILPQSGIIITGPFGPPIALGQTYYTFDERGNVSERTNSIGNPDTRVITDAYGNIANAYPDGSPFPANNRTPLDPFGFGAQFGYYTDNETGLVLCTYRYYDPENGRWLNRDPIGYAGGLNTYAYVIGNPVNSYDRLGQYATVKTNSSNVKIFIPIEFTFDKHIQDIKWWKSQVINDIENRWTGTFGKYTVTTTVVDVTYMKDYKKPYNSVRLISGDGRSSCKPGNPFKIFTDNEFPYGEWFTSRRSINKHTYAHEAGHLMGLDDRYSDPAHWPWEKVYSVPNKGWEENIMANSSMNVEERNIAEIIKRH